MLTNELRAVFVEAVGDEDGNIIHPRIARRCGKKNPLVYLGDLQKDVYKRQGFIMLYKGVKWGVGKYKSRKRKRKRDLEK